MSDNILFHLNNKFAIGYDSLQWMLMRVSKNEKTGGNNYGPKSFVRSTKQILQRCMDEAGCEPDQAGLREFQALSDTFKQWRAVK